MTSRHASTTRAPAVAGAFYPADARDLAHDLADYLGQSPSCAELGGELRALVVPHAGYVYSAPVAAAAFATLLDRALVSQARRVAVRRVAVLGPAHTVPLDGMAVPSAAAFDTPLGPVRVDSDLRARARNLPGVVVDDLAHAREHSIEVQLPFLQYLVPDLSVLPVVVGRAGADEVAQLVASIWDEPDTLIVVSTDLSHYEAYESAVAHDRRTAHRIAQADIAAIGPADACGAFALRGLLLAARARGYEVRGLALANSGDTAGPRDRVVGYGSFAVVEPYVRAAAPTARSEPTLACSDELDSTDRAWLLEAAEQSLRRALTPDAARRALLTRAPLTRASARLRAPGASFVTLHREGALRGCVGSLVAERSLADDVAAHALDAAFSDPRFRPLRASELAGLTLTISVIGKPEPIAVSSYAELVGRLRPGVDGVIVEAPMCRATLLPAVWRELPDPDSFVAALWRKAGLRPGAWPESVVVSRYRTEEFSRQLPDA